MPRAHPLRVGCVQYDPKLGEVDRNIAKVRELTQRLGPGELDLLVLPELALTGYVFRTAEEIKPYLEPQTGVTYELGAELAKRLGCHVIAGYPELLHSSPCAPEGHALPTSSAPAAAGPTADAPPDFDTIVTSAPEGRLAIPPPSDAPPSFDEATKDSAGKGVGYNSALIIDSAGELVGNYRKAFLYDADRPWCLPGPGFRYFDLERPLGRTVVGICMDLNPKDFLAPWNAYELSSFCRAASADTLVVPMAWLEPDSPDSDSDLDEEEVAELAASSGPEHPCLSNLNYWAARCAPLHDPAPSYSRSDAGVGEGGEGTGVGTGRGAGRGEGGEREGREGREEGKEVVFVTANRTGTERDTTFSGSSAVMRFRPSGVELIEALHRSEDRVLIAHVL